MKRDEAEMDFLMALLSVVLFIKISSSQYWDYQHQAEWYDNFGECSLNYQSPIEINSREAINSFFMPPLKFRNFNVSCTRAATISNSGRSVSIDLSDKCNRPQLSGGSLPYNATYETMSFHFHWGSRNQHGSEHIIDGQRYSLEAHIVNKNMKYSSMEEAARHLDGLAVQALFYKVNPSTKTPFGGLQNVVTSLKRVRKFNTKSLIKNVILSALFGNIDTSRFFTYQGSLTTPPCSQAVTWLVFPQVIDVNADQMQQFRLLADDKGKSLVNNYRFIQPKNGRSVYFRRNMIFGDVLSQPTTLGPMDAEEFYEENNTI